MPQNEGNALLEVQILKVSRESMLLDPPRRSRVTPSLPTSTFLSPTAILIENPKLIKRKGKWSDKCRKGDGTNTWSVRYLLAWTGIVYVYTINEVAFLVGGPWKFNLLLEKSWKNVAIFCMNPGFVGCDTVLNTVLYWGFCRKLGCKHC